MEATSPILLNELAICLEKDLMVSVVEEPENRSIESIYKLIHRCVADLLERDFEKLLQLMYRLDINETKFKNALDTPIPSEVSVKIADLVLEREIMKAKTRLLYKP